VLLDRVMNESRLLEDIRGQERSLARVLSWQRGEGLGALVEAGRILRKARKIVITGMGASLHAALPLQYELAGKGFDCSIVESGELLHYQERVCAGAVVVLVSRSGESVEVVKLLGRLKGLAEHTIGITNDASSALGRLADVAVMVGSLADQMVAVQSYTGTVAALLLLAGVVCGEPDARGEELDRVVAEISALVTEQVERVSEWDSFFRVGTPIYLLGRGPSYASALEGALLFCETAKEPAVGLAAGSFRHGPVEIVDQNFRAIVFAAEGRTRELSLGLARKLLRFGGRVRVVGPLMEGGGKLAFIGVPGVSEWIAPLAEVVPLQVAALRLAAVKGLEIGKFRFAPQVTRDEMKF
jgi:glucosamine--fructose-6-phosphate aminotransferase (isomerizing)